MNTPLTPHLLDIVSNPAADGLILGGGIGIILKQNWLVESGARTLITEIPEARATHDLDFFLSLELFVNKERGKKFRELLDALGYAEVNPLWKFQKPFSASMPNHKIDVDLLACGCQSVKVDHNRVKPRGGKTGVHGYFTEEAFAVESRPTPIPITGKRTDGQAASVTVFVPHPYASLNMKVKAAHDWLRRTRGELEPKVDSGKHVFDVYMLTAMLTETELNEAIDLSESFAENQMARQIQDNAKELFGGGQTNTAMTEIYRQMRQSGIASPPNYETFWQALQIALGIR